LPASGNGDILSFTAANATNASISGNFAATPVLNGCTGAATNFTITVNPPVSVNPISNVTFCNNATAPASAFTSVPTGASFNWTNSNTSIGLAASGSGNYAPFTAANTGIIASTATVGVDATLNGCTSPVVNYTITVNPTPPAPLTANLNYCLNNPAQPLSAIPSTGLQWYTNAALTNPSAIAPIPSTAVAGTLSYYVTQTISNCVSPPAQIQVLVNPLPVIAINPPVTTGCSPVCVTFSNPASTGNCFWNLGDGTVSNGNCTPTNCYVIPGTYTSSLTITDVNSCVNSGTAVIVVYPNPVADFNAGPQPTTILEPEITFTDESFQATIGSWSWSFGDAAGGISSMQDPIYTYSDTGTYVVQLDVVSNFGCTATVSKNITILDETLLYVPNAFSPNNDKLNDVFLPKGTGLKEYRLYIFDRWGNKIFTSSELEKGWDGNVSGMAALEDVYVWRIDGKDVLGNKKHLHGRVTLVR
ncbi:MAG: PKD domain-containing protein, partial [Bacteroidia bacterium]